MDAKKETKASLEEKLKDAKIEIKLLEEKIDDLEVKLEEAEEALKEAQMANYHLRKQFGVDDDYP